VWTTCACIKIPFEPSSVCLCLLQYSCRCIAHIALVNFTIPHKWPVETLVTKKLSFMRMAGTLIQLQLGTQLLQSPSHMLA